MKDQYVGDINDFAKFALLRHLAGSTGNAFRVGVVWYLTPNDDRLRDGNKTKYLCGRKARLYSSVEPYVFETLRSLVSSGRRTVDHLSACGLLPPTTSYFSEPVARDSARRDWFARAREASARPIWYSWILITVSFPTEQISAMPRSKRSLRLFDEVSPSWLCTFSTGQLTRNS